MILLSLSAINRRSVGLWFNRAKITLLIGCITLLLGAIFHWYRLPQKALETFGANLWLANLFRILPALLSIGSLAFIFGLGIRRITRLSFWWSLIAVLLFPYCIMTWSPTLYFLAGSYYDQASAAELHVETNFPEVQSQWKQNISLSVVKPINSIFELQIPDSRFFQAASWDRVIRDGFGYNNRFLCFIGRGWGLTVTGIVISLMGLYLGLQSGQIDAWLRDMRRLLPGVGLLLGLIVISLVWVNIVNHQLDTQFAKGEYHQVVTKSKSIASWYPPLMGDEAFLKRMAEAGFYAGEPDPALINFVKGLESYRLRNIFHAEGYFQKSLSINPSLFLVRGYLADMLINEGVDYFGYPSLPFSPHGNNYPNFFNNPFNPISPNNANSRNNRKTSRAADIFEQALEVFPGHILAIYYLMIARAIDAEFNKSAEIAQDLIEIQQYFQQPYLGLLGQAYLHLAWADYNQKGGDVAQAWQRYRQSIDPRTWKKSLEARQ